MNRRPLQRKPGGLITKEVLVGLVAIGLGSYNLAYILGYTDWDVTVSQMAANIVLVVTGVVLWITAFRLWRHRYHTRNLF